MVGYKFSVGATYAFRVSLWGGGEGREGITRVYVDSRAVVSHET
jgi:hypothetical protein